MKRMDSSISRIDKNSILPIYYQLKEYIKEQIDNGVWKVDQLISSEREFSEQFEINRMTVRQAINELVNEGQLKRQRGVGTYVVKPKVNQSLSKLTNFSSDMLNKGMKPGAIQLSMEVVAAPKNVARSLNIQEGDKIIELVRIRTADDEPMALERVHLIYEKAKNIVGLSLENKSLYRTLEEQCQIHLTKAVQTIEIATCKAAEAEYLGIEPYVPILLIERISYLDNNEPLEFVSSVYRADRYKFIIEMAT